MHRRGAGHSFLATRNSFPVARHIWDGFDRVLKPRKHVHERMLLIRVGYFFPLRKQLRPILQEPAREDHTFRGIGIVRTLYCLAVPNNLLVVERVIYEEPVGGHNADIIRRMLIIPAQLRVIRLADLWIDSVAEDLVFAVVAFRVGSTHRVNITPLIERRVCRIKKTHRLLFR